MIPEIFVGSILIQPSEIMTPRYSMEVLLKKHFSGFRYRSFFARRESVEAQRGKDWLVAEYRPVSKNYILCSGRYLPE